MKKLLLLITLFLFAYHLKASEGIGVVYHAKFYLKNGLVFNGLFGKYSDFEEAERDKNFYNNAGIFAIFKKQQNTLKSPVTVYKKIHYVRLRGMRKQPDKDIENYVFIDSTDVVLLNSTDISRIVFIKADQPWTAAGIITGPTDMLVTIQKNKYWNNLFSAKYEENFSSGYEEFGPDGGFGLYNYNPKINSAELKRLARLKFPLNLDRMMKDYCRRNKIKLNDTWTPEVENIYKAAMAEKVEELKRWFWTKGILLVEISGSC